MIVTFRDRLDGRVLAGEEGTMRLGRADETVLGMVPIGAAIDDFDLAGVAGFTRVLRPGVITTRRRELLLLPGRLADVLPIGVMAVERRVPITAGRLLDLPTVGRLTDELLATLLVLELLFLMGVTTVLRCEVDEPADEPVPPRLATSTERLTGREKDDRLGVDLGEGVDMALLGDAAGRERETLDAGLEADADLVDFGREAGRERETLGAGLDADFGAGLGAGLLTDLDGALAADRDTRDRADLAGEADRDFEAAFRAALLAGDDLAEGPDDLPLRGAALPNAGPKVIIAVKSTANNVFSNCLVNISRSFPGCPCL